MVEPGALSFRWSRLWVALELVAAAALLTSSAVYWIRLHDAFAALVWLVLAVYWLSVAVWTLRNPYVCIDEAAISVRNRPFARVVVLPWAQISGVQERPTRVDLVPIDGPNPVQVRLSSVQRAQRNALLTEIRRRVS